MATTPSDGTPAGSRSVSTGRGGRLSAPVARAIYFTSWVILRVLVMIWFRFGTRRSTPLPKGPCLLAANHASHLDPVLVGLGITEPVCFLARSTLFQPPWWGSVLETHNAIPIDRDGLDKSSFRTVVEVLRSGRKLVLFPEGTRSRDGWISSLKPGVVRIARMAKVPIVPVWVEGSGRAMSRSAKFPRPVHVSVRYGEPIDVSSFTTGDDGVVGAIREQWRTLAGREIERGAAPERDREVEGSSASASTEKEKQ